MALGKDEHGRKGIPGGSPVPQSLPRLVIRQGANLPHWRLDGSIYAVTFRLADSLPQEVLSRWKSEREDIVRRAVQASRPLSTFELRRLDKLHSERVENWLDQGHGSCVLRDPRVARLVADALRHFDGERYELLAWCVMPNHVHAVLQPFPGRELSLILLSWKGYTGKKAREILDMRGAGEFWQKESYDHIVRDEEDFARQVQYVLDNPAAAGLRDWPWIGGSASGIASGTALPGGEKSQDTGRKPGATESRHA
jgi:REP element-mobilizing transposase RayT